jgi:hypothetical protein
LPTDEPVILIGYSLGANATTRISHALPNREIALAIAYDPSIHSEVFPADGNVRRMLLYITTVSHCGATLAFPGRKSRRQKSTKAIYRLIPTSSFMPGP